MGKEKQKLSEPMNQRGPDREQPKPLQKRYEIVSADRGGYAGVEKVLNDRDLDGWEFVKMWDSTPTHVGLIFKRRG